MELNKIFIVGNLTRDPELRYTSGGTAVCDLGIASNRRYRKGGESSEMVEETCFVDVVVWGRSGENCNQYLKKGNSVLVEGRLKLDRWTAQDGQKRSKHTIVADRVHFFPRAGGGGGGESGGSQSYGESYHDDEPGEGSSRAQEDFNSEVPF
jgi:single-strand DNA-binding protein